MEASCPDSYVKFMRECKDAYADVCKLIAAGDVKAGSSAKITIKIPSEIIDRIRFDLLAAAAQEN